MANITYLFGAGASANVIPVVNNMKTRFQEIITYLTANKRSKFNDGAYETFPEKFRTYNHLLDSMIDDLEWLAKECYRHQTIDTLAKKYYLTGNDDLLRLKKTLIIYFTIEQLLGIPSSPLGEYTFNKSAELRYDSFFASVLQKEEDNSISVKNNLKILTWNYDLQIELALKNYIDKPISRIKELYNIYPNNQTISSDEQIIIPKDAFSALKINGNALLSNPTIIDEYNVKSVFDNHNKFMSQRTLLGEILEEYSLVSTMNSGKNLKESLLYFNFSWESDTSFTNKYKSYDYHIRAAEQIARQTKYLVIVGYSFPVFNREIDQTIIDSMQKLEKVYIQDPRCETIQSTFRNGFQILEDRLEQGVRVEFQLEKNVDQFLIPFEL
jgi:hypothetical protein